MPAAALPESATRTTVWPAQQPWGPAGRRLLGLGFVVLLLAMVALSVAVYQKRFTPAVWVTVRADRTGLQLEQRADVKLRGVLVGEVRDVAANGQVATLRVALDPDLVGQVPAGVSARMLPKSLLGEKYVDLVPPAHPTGRAIAAGAVIQQDRAAASIELEKVLDELMPLLSAIRPDQLSATLTALATALEGRGERLGQTLDTLDGYLKAMNQQLPTLREDIRRLGDVLRRYDAAMPDLLTILRESVVPANTITEQRDNLTAFFADTSDFADTGTAFLDKHGARLIQLGQVSRPLLSVLAAYAPEYPCFTAGLVKLQPNIEGAFTTGRLHITLEITRDSGKFQRGDEPAYIAKSGPFCALLPDGPPAPAPEYRIPDGYNHDTPHGPLDSLPLDVIPGPSPTDQNRPLSANLMTATMGYAGTAEEQSLISPLVAAASGRNVTEIGDLATLLWGPLLRGAVVDAR